MAKQKRQSWYLHTIRGKPAYYSERSRQIVFAGKASAPVVASLSEIRRDQARTLAWRKAQGFTDEPNKYGYVRVAVPHA